MSNQGLQQECPRIIIQEDESHVSKNLAIIPSETQLHLVHHIIQLQVWLQVQLVLQER
jgi:hypothetical protein